MTRGSSNARSFGALVRKLCGAEAPLPILDGPLQRQIRQQRLAPLAYRLGYKEFRDDFIQNAMFSELREKELVEIGQCLAGCGVPCVLLKGIAYSHTVYEDPAERSMGDIDLLVPSRDFRAAVSELTALGFVIRAGVQGHKAPTHHAMTLDRGDISLDLHRNMIQDWRSQVDLDGIWSRVRPASERGENLYYLAPTDELVFHLAHMARHELMSGALSYIDLNRLEATHGVSREEILCRAAEFRLERGAKAVLRTADRLRCASSHPMLPSLLPSPERVLSGTPLSRPRQLGTKAILVDGPRELIGLLGIGIFERLYGSK